MDTKKKASRDNLTQGEGVVLVVDDEPIMRKIATKVLKMCGYEVMVAEDGEKALEIFEKNHEKINLVLLDLLMPNKSGKDTYIEMKKIHPGVKVLVISGSKHDQRINELLKLGVQDYIEKPYTFTHLSEVVHTLVSEKKASTP